MAVKPFGVCVYVINDTGLFQFPKYYLNLPHFYIKYVIKMKKEKEIVIKLFFKFTVFLIHLVVYVTVVH